MPLKAKRIKKLEARFTQLEALNATKDNTIELLKEHMNTVKTSTCKNVARKPKNKNDIIPS